MFGLGFSEILCIAIIGVVILGPEHMPRVARKIGEWLAKMRSAATSLNDAISRDADLSSLRKDVLEVQNSVRDVGKLADPQKLLRDADKQLNQIARSVEGPLPSPNKTPSENPSAEQEPSEKTSSPEPVAPDAATGKPTSLPANDETAYAGPSAALFERLGRFYDEKRGTRSVHLAKPILVPSRIARATSRFSHRLTPPTPATAQTLDIPLHPPIPRRATEIHRFLSPAAPSTAVCKAIPLTRNTTEP